MKTLIVTVGRDSFRGTLSLKKWTNFKHLVLLAAELAGGSGQDGIYFEGEGQGHSATWGDEEAYTVVVGLPKGTVTPGTVWRLSSLAKQYDQEAIAYTVGETNLIEAEVEV